MDSSSRRRSLRMFIASMLIFGTIGIFRRHIPVSSAFLACFRGLMGGLFMLIWLRLTGKKAGRHLPVGVMLPLIASGAVMGINWILLFEAYNYTTVGVATLCYYMEPTLVMLLSPLFFGERLTLKKCLCAAAAVLGMVLVSGVAEGAAPRGNHLRGILLGLAAAVCYAGVVILNKRIHGVDAWQKTVIQLFSAGAVMIPYLLVTGETVVTGPFTPVSALLLLLVGLIHTGLAYVLYFGSMDGLRAQTIALLSYIDPVSALLFSAVLLGESLSPAGLAGAALIIGSALISEARD